MSKAPTPLSFWHPVSLIATWGGAGLLPGAPGTWGSLAALPFIWICYTYGGLPALWVFTLGAFFIGWWAVHAYMLRIGRRDDPKEIVIDEVAGQSLTLLPVFFLFPDKGWLYAMGFVLFRVFDIGKPWPIRWVDRKMKNALGIMLDDILAAIPAAALCVLSFYLIYDR